MVVNEHGQPMEVIIPWENYLEIEELLGLDLDELAIDDLRQGRSDRKQRKGDAYLNLRLIHT